VGFDQRPLDVWIGVRILPNAAADACSIGIGESDEGRAASWLVSKRGDALVTGYPIIRTQFLIGQPVRILGKFFLRYPPSSTNAWEHPVKVIGSEVRGTVTANNQT